MVVQGIRQRVQSVCSLHNNYSTDAVIGIPYPGPATYKWTVFTIMQLAVTVVTPEHLGVLHW